MESDQLKEKVQQSSILSEAEKKDWLFLLPKMTDAQKQELARILEVRMPQSSDGKGQRSEFQPMPAPQPEPKRAAPPVSDSPGITPSPAVRSPVTVQRPLATSQTQNTSLLDIQGLSFVEMRQAPSIYEFFDDMGAKMVVIVKTGQASPEEVIQSFGASALHKAYLKAGRELLEGKEPLVLSRSEFEAIADFKSSLKKILQGT